MYKINQIYLAYHVALSFIIKVTGGKNIMYTTGEVAKICHVSKRTVQYYDYEGIVQPSQILEHGKRVYSKEDIQKFQLVLLYKDLGLSLKDIRYIFEQDHQDTLLIQILEQQYQKNQKQLTHLQQKNQEISVLLQELQDNHALTVFNYQELHDLIKDQKYQKTIHLTYLFLCLYVLVMIFTIFLSRFISDKYVAYMLIFDFILLLMLIKFHQSHYAYICPQCHQRITISFFQDLLCLHNGSKGKYLKCPYCHQRSWMKETYRDES